MVIHSDAQSADPGEIKVAIRIRSIRGARGEVMERYPHDMPVTVAGDDRVGSQVHHIGIRVSFPDQHTDRCPG